MRHKGRTLSDPGRDETEVEQLDRNWAELLQELRVVQTGVQLLTGFLLTLPFQQRFRDLGSGDRFAYLLAVTFAAGATVVLIAPVALHRLLFRRHVRGRLVRVAHLLALVGTAMLGFAVVVVVFLVFDVVEGGGTGYVAGGVALGVVIALWALMPLAARLVDARSDPTGAAPEARGSE